jgi:hypothetical protein
LEQKAFITKRKMLIIFLLSLTSNFLGSWFGYALNHDQIVTQAVIGFFLPQINFLSAYWFIEAKTILDRFKITLISSFALSLGGTLMLLSQRYFSGVTNGS